MEKHFRAEAARRFSHAADAMVDACRALEECGIDDEPVEQLLQALEVLTRKVHQLVPPPDRLTIEPADQAIPACRIASQQTYDFH